MQYSNNPAESRYIKKRIYNEFFIMFVFGLALCFYFLYIHSIAGSPTLKTSNIPKGALILQGFYGGAAIIAGWKALNKITPNVFLILPIVGWVIYFVLKLFLSVTIGMFILPIRLFLNIRKLVIMK